MASETAIQSQSMRAGVAVFVAACVVIIWSATPTATAFALDSLDPLMAAALRTGIAGLFALPLALIFRFPLPSTLGDGGLLLVAGFCAFFFFPILLAAGLERTSASHAALIIAVCPVATGMIAAVLDRTWPSPRWWIGVAIAVLGEYFLIAGRGDAVGSGNLIGDLLCVAGMMIVAFSYIAGSRLSTRIGAMSVSLWGVSLAALPSLVIVIVTSGGSIPEASVISWRAIFFLAIATSILGYAGWYWALAVGGVSRIAPLQFLVPVLGVFLAVMLLDEAVTASLLVATVAIVGGVVIATWPRQAAR